MAIATACRVLRVQFIFPENRRGLNVGFKNDAVSFLLEKITGSNIEGGKRECEKSRCWRREGRVRRTPPLRAETWNQSGALVGVECMSRAHRNIADMKDYMFILYHLAGCTLSHLTMTG